MHSTYIPRADESCHLCGADVENLVHIFRELCGRLGHFFDICYFLLDVA